MKLSELLETLGYDTSSHYYSVDEPVNIEVAHCFRAAREVGVNGIYVFETSPSGAYARLGPRPAVYVAEANTETEARIIHRNLWNFGYAPFVIVLLPHQVRIYTGFNYAEGPEESGLIDKADKLEQIVDLLCDFKAQSIDSGLIWKSQYYEDIDPDQRVDRRLLRNLEQLGEALESDGLSDEVAHALIGKYVYLSYLRSRQILTDEWMTLQNVDPRSVFSFNANVSSLRRLVDALEDRFNGKVFPIDFENEKALQDKHVSWLASVFSGSEVLSNAPEAVHQLCFSFRAYDFRYIPVETLSAIYEQFIRDRKKKGAIYTPEVLADYLLSEMEATKPLERGMKVLDPACGSGVFLVLAYRRLIEKEIRRSGSSDKLKPQKLRDILVESIYGTERERDACFVTEFSLILTLLNYTEPRDLANLKFKFPDLHNKQIFKCDFFDLEGEEDEAKFWQQELKFDWITGNPPWIELKPLKPDTEDTEPIIRAWIENPANMREYPIGGKRVAEAFSWLVTRLLGPDGIVGLFLPATSLFNKESRRYRQSFFTRQEVLRITNFANLRDILFGREKSGVLPAMGVVYRPATDIHPKPHIIHYGPFCINQVSTKRDKPWVITINESEIKSISPYEAEKGDMLTWKLALWGTHRDKRTMERVKHLFPTTLKNFCNLRGWGKSLPTEGPQLRPEQEDPTWSRAEVKGKKEFDTKKFNEMEPSYRFSIPDPRVLPEITEDRFIRSGADALRLTTPAPHIILSASWQNFAIYSDDDFIIPPRQMAIAAPELSKENEDYLRALTVYLSSSLVAYYLFFQVPEWGVFRQRKSVTTKEVQKIPVPDLTTKQASELAEFHRYLVESERESKTRFVSELIEKRKAFAFESTGDNSSAENVSALLTKEKKEIDRFVHKKDSELQVEIDVKINELFKIPKDISLLANEFTQFRLLLDKPPMREEVLRKPAEEELLSYAQQLQTELDTFAMDRAFHQVEITHSDKLIQCVVEITKESVSKVNKNNIRRVEDLSTAHLLDRLGQNLKQRVSQWIYVQRGLRFYDGPWVYIFKSPRLIDWTRTQAMDDAADIIGQVVTST